MADNTDTELLDWLDCQPGATLQREVKPYPPYEAVWYVRVDGTAVWHSSLRRALTLLKELKGKPKTATKGE